MATSKQAVTSLLTEHFRYTPLTLLDDIINTVNELVYRAVNAVEEGLSSAPSSSLGFAEAAAAAATASPDTQTQGHQIEKDDDGNDIYPESRVEIEDGVHQLETLLQSTVDKNFDKLEIYVLRNILNVPEELAGWMRLGHYENLAVPTQPQTQTQTPPPTPETLQTLRRKLIETRKLHACLVAEHARNAALISQLQSLLAPSPQQAQEGPLAFLTSSPSAQRLGLAYPPFSAATASQQRQQPLTTHTRFALSQLPALRQLLGALRPKVDNLQYQRSSTAADERREYIESETRRHLETQGVDVGSGEGLGAASSSLGRKVGPEEVGSIEGVVGLIEEDAQAAVGRRRGDGDMMEE